MLRVRFPSGITVQYNTATLLKYNSYAYEIYEKEGGEWIASVQLSSGAIIENIPACHVYSGVADGSGSKLDAALKHVADIKRKISKLSTKERKARR